MVNVFQDFHALDRQDGLMACVVNGLRSQTNLLHPPGNYNNALTLHDIEFRTVTPLPANSNSRTWRIVEQAQIERDFCPTSVRLDVRNMN